MAVPGLHAVRGPRAKRPLRRAFLLSRAGMLARLAPPTDLRSISRHLRQGLLIVSEQSELISNVRWLPQTSGEAWRQPLMAVSRLATSKSVDCGFSAAQEVQHGVLGRGF